MEINILTTWIDMAIFAFSGILFLGAAAAGTKAKPEGVKYLINGGIALLVMALALLWLIGANSMLQFF